MKQLNVILTKVCIKGENGIAMVAAIMLVLAFAVLGVVAVITTTGEVSMTKNIQDSSHALSIAEAGVSYVAEDMPDTFSALATYNPITSVGTKSFAGGTFRVISYANDPISPYRKIVTIEAIKGEAKRQVKATISVIPQSFRYALFSEKQIDLSAQNINAKVYITGNMRANSGDTSNNRALRISWLTAATQGAFSFSNPSTNRGTYPTNSLDLDPDNPTETNPYTIAAAQQSYFSPSDPYITVPEVKVVDGNKVANQFQTFFGNTAANFPGRTVYYISSNYSYTPYTVDSDPSRGGVQRFSTSHPYYNIFSNGTSPSPGPPGKVSLEVKSDGVYASATAFPSAASPPVTENMRLWKKPASAPEWTALPERDGSPLPSGTFLINLTPTSSEKLDENSLIIVEGNVDIFGNGNFNHILAAYTCNDLSPVRTPRTYSDQVALERTLFEWGEVIVRDNTGAATPVVSNINFNPPSGLGIFCINLKVNKTLDNSTPTRINFGTVGDGMLLYTRNLFSAVGSSLGKLEMNAYGSIISKGPEPTTHYYELLLGGIDDGFQYTTPDGTDGPVSTSRHDIRVTYDASYLNDLPRFWVDDPNLVIYPIISEWEDVR